MLDSTLCIGILAYLVLHYGVYGSEVFGTSDAIQWVHVTFDNEQKVKLLYMLDNGYLNIADEELNIY